MKLGQRFSFLRIASFLVIPSAFAFLGVFLFYTIQNSHRSTWELVLNEHFQEYGLDSKPVGVLDSSRAEGIVLTENNTTYKCIYKSQDCIVTSEQELPETYGAVLKRTSSFMMLEIPKFDGKVKSVLKVKSGIPEIIIDSYYLTSEDGSIWYWYRRENLLNDILGVGGIGCSGLVIGLILVSLADKKLEAGKKLRD